MMEAPGPSYHLLTRVARPPPPLSFLQPSSLHGRFLLQRTIASFFPFSLRRQPCPLVQQALDHSAADSAAPPPAAPLPPPTAAPPSPDSPPGTPLIAPDSPPATPPLPAAEPLLPEGAIRRPPPPPCPTAVRLSPMRLRMLLAPLPPPPAHPPPTPPNCSLVWPRPAPTLPASPSSPRRGTRAAKPLPPATAPPPPPLLQRQPPSPPSPQRQGSPVRAEPDCNNPEVQVRAQHLGTSHASSHACARLSDVWCVAMRFVLCARARGAALHYP